MKDKERYSYKLTLTKRLDVKIRIFKLINGKWKEIIQEDLELGRMQKIDKLIDLFNKIKNI
jgi:hypothetical protein